MKLRRTCAALAAALTLCLSVGARAEDEPLDRRTPRGAMHDYLAAARAGNFERAAEHLDLSRVPPARRASQGPELARHLKIVLDQTLWVDLDALSGNPEGNADDGLPAGRDRVGKIQTERGDVPVILQRLPGPDGAPIWKISSSSVALVPELYEEFGFGPLGKILPSAFFETQILEVQLWQWIALLILAVLAYALAWLLVTLGLALASPVVARSDTTLDDELLHAVAGPSRLVLFVVTFAMAGRALSLAVPVQRVLSSAVKATAAIAVTWLLMRLVDVVAELATRRLEARGAAAHQFMPLGRKALKGFLVVIAVLATMDSFGFNVTALLAGLGVGGLAVALAAQKTLENLFGGVTLLADRPVQVGDFCRFGDKVGVVEDIGLRSTRVRTLDRTLITVPNAEFSTLQLENFAVRDQMRLFTVLGLRYETTAEQLRVALEEIRSVLVDHPRVTDEPRRVRFVGFGDSSLDVEIFAYVTTQDYNEYMQLREEIFLLIMDAVERAGTGFAFPSRTVYLAQDDGISGLPAN